MSRERERSLPWAAFAFACLAFSGGTAAAHDGARSSFEVRSATGGVQVVLRLDADVMATKGEPLAYVDARFVVTDAAGARCAREAPRSIAVDSKADVMTVDVVYACAGRVTIDSTLFHDGPPHPVTGSAPNGQRLIFNRQEHVQTIDVPVAQAGGFRMATPPAGAFDAPPQPSVPAPAPRSTSSSPSPWLIALIVLLVAYWLRRVTTTSRR